jgi:hypothetical protein
VLSLELARLGRCGLPPRERLAREVLAILTQRLARLALELGG